MEGILTVNDASKRYSNERKKTVNEVNQYANNFSEIADMVDLGTHLEDNSVMFLFANAIKQKAKEHLVKIQFRDGL